MIRTVSTAAGRGAIAVTPHHEATRAAIDAIGAGGNAVDGAIAANAVLGVVLPTTCGIGGDLFAIIHRPGREAPDVLNASGRGGGGLDAGAIRRSGHEDFPLFSPWAVTVPGCIDGWVALLERHGTLSLGDLLQPAIRLATEGFPVSTELAAALAGIAGRVIGQASSPPLFPDGHPPQPGRSITRPGLAATLGRVAATERAAFYEGPVAAAICRATGGVLTPDDLAGNRPDWVEPIGIDVFGRRAWTVPPNSQGYVALAAAWIFEHLDPGTDPADPGFHHAAIEAYRAVAWERGDLVSDTPHSPLAPERLLDPGRLAERLEAIGPAAATHWPPAKPEVGGTAYLAVVDGAGMGVSLIQSNFCDIGAGISADDTGVWLHNRGAGFSLSPGHPNEAAPGKRPLHTLAPTLWTCRGRLSLLLGTRGGHQQPQYLLQSAALLHAAGLDPEAAQAHPRWSMKHAGPGTRSEVEVEQRMAGRVVAGLSARGHTVERRPDWPPSWGPVSMIACEEGDTRRAAADPRVSTASAAAG